MAKMHGHAMLTSSEAFRSTKGASGIELGIAQRPGVSLPETVAQVAGAGSSQVGESAQAGTQRPKTCGYPRSEGIYRIPN